VAHAEFVHLRVHSAYSLSQGAMHISAIARACERHAMPAVALTDTTNLFGALEFSVTLSEAGVQPIIGCTLPVGGEEAVLAGGKKPEPAAVVVLAQNDAGYANLMKLVSKAHLETDPGETPQVSRQTLEALGEGLIVFTGGPAGPVGRLLLEGQREAAEACLRDYAAAFPGRLYVEIMRHNREEESRTEADFLDLAYQHDLPLVATNQVLFADEGMFEAHDALLCVAAGSYVGETDRQRLTPDFRFKSPEEMRLLFADLPEAVDNTLVIARRCAVKAPLRKPILPRFADSPRQEAELLRAQARAGLTRRLEGRALSEEVAKTYWARLDYELDIIERMNFPGYFLIVADFIQWAKSNGVPVGPGRGSGAGSVVAWALTITDLDPLRFSLLFERFLNPERVSMPDFDIDFCQEKRDRVIHYVQEKYGYDQVAQIITFGKLQARAVLRDVGRVLQMPYGQVDRLCKMVPNNPAAPVRLAEAIDGEPRLKYERDNDETVARLLDIALRLEGLYRHASTHAAGVVIGDRPLDELVPLYRDPRSTMPVTQFNMKWVEPAGLVKFDFLGLKTLTVIDRTVRYLARRGITIDPAQLPLDDEKTFAMLARGDTAGVFQLESSGMRDVLKKMRPDSFEDIIALVALYRPGPMENIPSFIKRKHGDEAPDYMHEWLEPILRETYGVIIYQEQVMQIAQVLAGYSLGEADLLRRAMGKKKKAEMDAQRARFAEGATQKGVNPEKAQFIFDLVAKFAGYGFNKSHAAAYALVAYQTAWLKANYPVEFLAASMTLDLGNTDKLNFFRQELGRQNIPLLPPDINRSQVEFSVEETGEGKERRLAVRYALAAIKNVGRQAMEGLLAEREAGGGFADLFDFAGRIDPHQINKRQMENLARAGAFDSLNDNRAQVFQAVETLLRTASAAAEDRVSGQTSLFGAAGGGPQHPALPEVAPWRHMEKLQEEFAAIGFFLTAHPIDAYARALCQQKVVSSGDVTARVQAGRTGFKLAGVIARVQERKSARGNPFAFVELSDAAGSFEVTVFSEILSSARALLEPGKAIVVTVEARLEDETARLTAQRIEAVEAVVANAGAGMSLRLESAEGLERISQLLEQHRRGRGFVSLLVELDGGARQVEIELAQRYSVTPDMIEALSQTPGVLEAREI